MPLSELVAVLNNPPAALRGLQDIPGLYVVGGFLRDAWSGRSSPDIDLATGQNTARAAQAAATALEGHAFELGPKFGTWRVVHGNGEVDISPLHSAGIEADLARRDFTVNALALRLADLESGAIADRLLHHPRSLDDLQSGTVRMISRDNLLLDPARILRAYRIAAVSSMQIDSATRSCLAELAPRLLDSAAERLHEELMRWLSHNLPLGDTVRICAEDGVLWQLFPGLETCRGCEQNDFHHLDVWTHTLLALEELDRLLAELPLEIAVYGTDLADAMSTAVSGSCNGLGITRLALLLHDCGKPATRQVQPDGSVSFHGHQEAGVVLAEDWLDRLKCTNSETEAVKLLVMEHLRLGFYCGEISPPPKLVHRYIRRLREFTPLMVLHGLADCLATRGPLSAGGFGQHLLAAQTILQHFYAADNVARPPVWLDGNDIMLALELPPGPLVGQVKSALDEASATGEVYSRDSALEYIRRLDQHTLNGEV